MLSSTFKSSTRFARRDLLLQGPTTCTAAAQANGHNSLVQPPTAKAASPATLLSALLLPPARPRTSANVPSQRHRLHTPRQGNSARQPVPVSHPTYGTIQRRHPQLHLTPGRTHPCPHTPAQQEPLPAGCSPMPCCCCWLLLLLLPLPCRAAAGCWLLLPRLPLAHGFRLPTWHP